MPPNAPDMETIKLVAQSAAKEVAEEIGRQLREDLRIGFDYVEKRMVERIDTQFQLRFGDMKPAEHLVQHSRLQHILDNIDSTRKKIWQTVAGELSKAAVIALLAWGAFMWHGKGG